MAITWRSLMGQNPDPVRAMSAAQDSFDGMFSSLNGALTKYQNQQLAQENKLKSDNLEKFYADASSRYSSPEAFQAALASGELQGLASSYGDAIDMSKVREFSETRGGVLQQRQQNQWKYQKALEEQAAAPVLDEVLSSIEVGDFEKTNALLSEHALPNKAALYEALRKRQEGATDTAHQNAIRPLDLQGKQLALESSGENLRGARINREGAELNLTAAKEQRTAEDVLSQAYMAARGKMMENGLPNENAMTEAAAELSQGLDPRIAAKVLQSARQADVANVQAWQEDQDKNGYVGSVSLNPTAVSSSLEEVIKTIPEDDQESVRSRVNKLIRDGVTIPKGTKLPNEEVLKDDMIIPIPFNVARSAILESTSNLIGFRRGVDATSIIEQQMRRPEVVMDILMRDRAVRLKESLRGNPDLPSNEKRKK